MFQAKGTVIAKTPSRSVLNKFKKQQRGQCGWRRMNEGGVGGDGVKEVTMSQAV